MPAPPTREVNSWIARARLGDRSALGSLFGHLEPRLAAYVATYMNPQAKRWMDPQDILQRVFAEAVDDLRTLSEEATEEMVVQRLRQIARCRTMDEFRKIERQIWESTVGELDACVCPRETSAETMMRSDTARLVHESVASLPENARTVVIMRVLEDKSFEEIGEASGVSAATARKRYARASLVLRGKFSSRGLT